MNHPKISIIVPVYNVEKYLKECVESVLAQTFIDFELLLIDDGSTDRSAEICDEYVQKDQRVRVFHKENGGQPSALNHGIDRALGEYIMFLDSDDYWCENRILEKLYQKAKEEDLDIVRAECKEVNNNGDVIKIYKGGFYKEKYKGTVVDSIFLLDKIADRKYFMVLYLIKKDAIGSLRYNENRVFLQDAELNLRLCSQNLRCMYIDDVFYAYRKHESAITILPHPQKLHDAFDFSRFCFSLSEELVKREMNNFVIKEGIRNLIFDLEVLAESSRNVRELKEAFDEYSIYDLMQTAFKKSFTISLKYSIILLFPVLYIVLMLRLWMNFKKRVRKLLKRF